MSYINTPVSELDVGDLKALLLATLIDHESIKKEKKSKRIRNLLSSTVMAATIGSISANDLVPPKTQYPIEDASSIAPDSAMSIIGDHRSEVSKPVETVKTISQTISSLVNFPSGGAKISPAQRDRLDEFIRALPKGAEVSLVGHADSVGSSNANLVMSKIRAVAVGKYLAYKGVKVKTVAGAGSAHPVEKTDGPSLRNRRVDATVTNITSKIDYSPKPVIIHSHTKHHSNHHAAHKFEHLRHVETEYSPGVEVGHYVPKEGDTILKKVGENKNGDQLFFDGNDKMVIRKKGE